MKTGHHWIRPAKIQQENKNGEGFPTYLGFFWDPLRVAVRVPFLLWILSALPTGSTGATTKRRGGPRRSPGDAAEG